MNEVSSRELRAVLADPETFYEAIAGRRGYVPKAPLVPGDCEFILTDILGEGCIVACCVVHRERRAFLMLFDSDALTDLRASLEQRHIELNSALLLRGVRVGQ